MDYGALKTDAEYLKLEKDLKKIYTESAKDIQQKMNVFFAKYEKKNKEWLDKIQASKGTDEEKQVKNDYEKWLKGQVFQGQQWQARKESIANTLANTNEIAINMVNSRVPNVLQINGNYAAYQIENQAGVNFGFNLYDSTTVKELIKDDIDVLPYKKLNRTKDIQWNFKAIKSELTKGIIQGESIDKIAKRLAIEMPNRNMKMVRTHARTMYTSAQNQGRLVRYQEAEEMGIKIKKQWMATLDDRTRFTHQELDGQIRDLDEPFEVEGYEIMFPADPHVEPSLSYNCRCTLNNVIEKYPPQYTSRHDNSGTLIENMSYRQWEKWKGDADGS